MTEPTAECPGCGGRARRVSPTTVAAMLSAAAKTTDPGQPLNFCRTASCPVVYVDRTSGRIYTSDDVRVVVFQKSDDPGRPVCYCFGHTVRDVRDGAEASGRSAIADAITARCRAGEDDCERNNPQGVCCLGNVRRVAKGGRAGPAGDDDGCCGADRRPADEPANTAPDGGR